MKHVARLLRNPKHLSPVHAKFVAVTFAVCTLCSLAPPLWAQEPSEIAKQAQNPIASLISVPIENDFNPQTGIKKDDSYFSNSSQSSQSACRTTGHLITRTVIPMIQVPDLAPGRRRNFRSRRRPVVAISITGQEPAR